MGVTIQGMNPGKGKDGTMEGQEVYMVSSPKHYRRYERIEGFTRTQKSKG